MNNIHLKRGSLLVSIAAAAMLVPLSAAANDHSGDKSMKEQAKTLTERAGDMGSDIRMHVAIETAFARSDELSALSISTDVSDGAVRLKGEVETNAQKELATELAKSVDGVKSVRNDIKVTDGDPSIAERIGQGASDAALTARVKTRLLASNNTSGLSVRVSTDDEIVTLSGEVESDTERELAELIAANTSGVAKVNNELKVAKNY